MPGGMVFDRGQWQFGQGNKPLLLNDLTQDDEVIAVLEALINGLIGGEGVAAADVAVTPGGQLAATNVQSALLELDGDITTRVAAATAALVASAPAALDTLDELAAALGDDSNYAATTTAALAARVLKSAVPVTLVVALSDETTDITAGTAKLTFRMPHAMTLTGVRASLATAGSTLTTVDINEGGSSILSTKLTIDATEKTSTTAAAAAVISDAALADDAEITMDIDGAGTGAKGLKVTLIGTRAI